MQQLRIFSHRLIVKARGLWIGNFMEYDVEIRPTKFIKGQGLAKLLVDSNCQYLGLHLVED